MAQRLALITELKHESTNTVKILERIPDDKMDWRPHPKSRPVRKLGAHITELASWPAMVLHSNELDISDKASKHADMLHAVDLVALSKQGAKESIEALQQATDEQLAASWILRRGEQIILQMPRSAVIRRLCFNHLYHHRAQLGVYLRLLDIPVPGMYGPSADDMEHFKE